MTTIKGAVALVTGGQRGLGKAFVQELLDAGASKVYATARAPKPSEDPRVVPLALEVTDQDSVDALVAATGDVTIVINNAGAGGAGPLLSGTVDFAKELFDINVFGPLRVAKAYAPVLAANGGGALVDIHSALTWAAGAGAYGASKAAFWSLTNSLRVELEPQSTQVVGVHLGYTDTDMIAGLDVPKNDPRQVARDTLVAVEAGETEVLADEVSAYIKNAVAGPVEGLTLR